VSHPEAAHGSDAGFESYGTSSSPATTVRPAATQHRGRGHRDRIVSGGGGLA